jgi:ABC-type transport system involved in multi-copper enzyme maturation permease subunit
VSLNPVRETLEEYFVKQVRGEAADRRDERCDPWLIAGAVFKESVRDRVPYAMVVFAVLLMAASYLIGQLTAGQDMKIIKDLGLAALSIFGLFIAVFIGIGLVSKEVEKKSVFGLLSKPSRAAEFILGKYAGLVMTLPSIFGA